MIWFINAYVFLMLYLVFSQQLLAFWAPTVYQNWTEYTEQDLDLPVWKPESTAIMGKALWMKPLGLSGKLTPAVEFECSQAGEGRGQESQVKWACAAPAYEAGAAHVNWSVMELHFRRLLEPCQPGRRGFPGTNGLGQELGTDLLQGIPASEALQFMSPKKYEF